MRLRSFDSPHLIPVSTVAIYIVIICCAACGRPAPGLPANDPFRPLIPPSAGHRYFAQDTVSMRMQAWGSEVLFQAKEPDFAGYKGKGDFVRFVWLRAMENPVVVRIHRFSDTVYTHIKELHREAGGYSIVKDTLILLDIPTWHAVTRPLHKNRFWTMAPEPTPDSQDGATWYIESKSGEDYRVMEGWDDGNYSSPMLRMYLKPLLLLAEKTVRIKTAKGKANE